MIPLHRYVKILLQTQVGAVEAILSLEIKALKQPEDKVMTLVVLLKNTSLALIPYEKTIKINPNHMNKLKNSCLMNSQKKTKSTYDEHIYIYIYIHILPTYPFQILFFYSFLHLIMFTNYFLPCFCLFFFLKLNILRNHNLKNTFI